MIRVGYQKSSTLTAILKTNGELQKALAPLGVRISCYEFTCRCSRKPPAPGSPISRKKPRRLRLNKARLWSLDHLPEYARSTAELTKLPDDVLLSAYTAQRTSPVVIDTSIVSEIQAASDRATRYGILARTLDVGKAVDRSFTAAAAGSN